MGVGARRTTCLYPRRVMKKHAAKLPGLGSGRRSIAKASPKRRSTSPGAMIGVIRDGPVKEMRGSSARVPKKHQTRNREPAREMRWIVRTIASRASPVRSSRVP